MPLRKDPRNEHWMYRFKLNRRDYCESGFRTYDQAKKAEIKRKDEAINERTYPNKPSRQLTVEEAGNWFLENHAKKHKRSWKNDRARVGQMVRFFGQRLIDDITPEDVDSYLDWVSKTQKGRNGGKLTDHTRNHYLADLKALINRLKKNRLYMGDNPANYVQIKKVPRVRVRYLTTVEEKTLSPIIAQDSVLWPYYFTALHTGLRVSEIANMRVEDIDCTFGRLFIPNSKNSRSRHVPISQELKYFLMDRITGKKPNDYALAGVIGDYVSRRFRWAVRDAQIVNLKFHDLRHTFASRLLQKGVPIYKVSKILGHSSVVVTEKHYGHFSWMDLRDAIEQIDGVIQKPVATRLQREVLPTLAISNKMVKSN